MRMDQLRTPDPGSDAATPGIAYSPMRNSSLTIDLPRDEYLHLGAECSKKLAKYIALPVAVHLLHTWSLTAFINARAMPILTRIGNHNRSDALFHA